MKKYARVSQILATIQDFSHINQQVLKAKQIVGTNVHSAIQDTVDGLFPVVTTKENGYLQSFEKWFDLEKPEFIIKENRYYDDTLMLTGQVDAVLKMNGKLGPVLVDWKTSVKESAIVWPMQAHFYHYLLKQNSIDIGEQFLFVKLDPNGKLPKVFEYKFDQVTWDKCREITAKFWENCEIVDNNTDEIVDSFA